MEILTFDLLGKFAHFRKYYANNTAFSYSLPPRTALMGMVAAMLGLPRDSYYSELGSENLRFGIRILSPVKKSFHRLNHLKVIGISDFRGRLGHTQTPFEVVTGLDLRTDYVQYRIYLSPNSAIGKEVFIKVKACLEENANVFSLTLGAANFTAQARNLSIFSEDSWREKDGSLAEFLPIHSAVYSEQVVGINPSGGKLLVEEELIPADFIADFNRELSRMCRVLFSTDGKPMLLHLKGKYIELDGPNGEYENIMFLD